MKNIKSHKSKGKEYNPFNPNFTSTTYRNVSLNQRVIGRIINNTIMG